MNEFFNRTIEANADLTNESECKIEIMPEAYCDSEIEIYGRTNNTIPKRIAISGFTSIFRSRRKYYYIFAVVLIASFAAGFSFISVSQFGITAATEFFAKYSLENTALNVLLRALPAILLFLIAFTLSFTPFGKLFSYIGAVFAGLFCGALFTHYSSGGVASVLKAAFLFSFFFFIVALYFAECCSYRDVAKHGRATSASKQNTVFFSLVFFFFCCILLAVCAIAPSIINL